MSARDKNGMNLSPHTARPIGAAQEAWWYENLTRIEVYVSSGPEGRTLACSIDRRWLKAWLEKTEASTQTA
jgi:hypothetical protein